MAEGRNSRKRLLSDLEVDSQLIPPFQNLCISNEETTVCVPAATSGASSSNHHSSICLPSSSKATGPTRWKYDVFLSFRGLDTRPGITAEICDRLQSRGIRTFMDDPDLRKGDPISHKLMEAIEGSRFAIVVLSPHYADSTWCLKELVKICECMRTNSNEKRIFPIFYHVEPTEVRFQNKGSFKEAFTKHEASSRHQPETMDKWRAALKQVADYSAWTTNAFKTYRELIDDVVQTLRKMVAPNAIEFTSDFHAYKETIKAMDKVNEALRDEKVTIVGVHGMGGVGKTTMVRHVAEQACKNGTFNLLIMATISKNHNVKRIQGILSGFLGVELDENLAVEARAAKLREEIMRKEKLVIILDDVWDYINLFEIGIPNLKGLQDCNSKMLVTTRRRNVCQSMECQRRIILEHLSENDSWDLFVRKAGDPFNSTLENVARKVAKECSGLPIALVTVAIALKDKGLHEWERAAQRIENSQCVNPDDDGKTLECIRLSYDYLKNEYKLFFLLCCLFPEDHEINIEDLFMYAIGKGLFRDAETLEEARKDAKIWVGYLQDSCLLLGQDGTDIKMHDVVRDAAIQIAQSGEHNFLVKADCGLIRWPRQIHEDYTAISLMGNYISKLPENLVCPKLQILLLNKNYCIEEIPETFFKSLNDLRILDLSHPLTEGEGFSFLPQSISLLTNLTFLSLLGCHDQLTCETSTLGKLKKLEILYLPNIDSGELSIELGGLTNLRIFSCDDKSIKRIPPGVISEWKNLEELHLKGYRHWRFKIVEEEEETINAGFEEVTSLSKLRVIKATIFHTEALPAQVDPVPDWVEFNIIIGDSFRDWGIDEELSLPYSRSIVLHLDNISKLPKWFRDGLMKKAEFLYWEGCKNLSDIFVDLEHGRLLKLKHLHLAGFIDYDRWKSFTDNEIEQSSSGKMGESFTQDEFHRNPTRIPVLENLEKLSLFRIDCEKSWEAVQTLPPGSLANLKELRVVQVIPTDVNSDLTEGNTLLPSAMLKILSNLEKISIYVTRKRYIFGHDGLVVSLPRNIELYSCSIIGICEGRAPPTMFQNLQRLNIAYCNELKGSLFTHEVAQCLPQLDSLSLDRCELLERIVEAGNNKTILPKLRVLSLEKCPVLYCERGSLDIECPSLEFFKLSDCPKFAASFDDFNSRKQQKPISWWSWLYDT